MQTQSQIGLRIRALGLVLIWAASAQGQIIYVDKDATEPTHDGSSWCNAYLTVQDTLVAATAATTIRVADGTYRPDQGGGQTPGDQSATFQLKNGVTLQGGYAGCAAPDPDARDIATHQTIFSGDLNGDDTPGFGNIGENSDHVVTGSRTDATAVLDGFTITAGNANDAFLHASGGGMYNSAASPTVTNCMFSGNSAVAGGGM